jgi:hypothetical protein
MCNGWHHAKTLSLSLHKSLNILRIKARLQVGRYLSVFLIEIVSKVDFHSLEARGMANKHISRQKVRKRISTYQHFNFLKLTTAPSLPQIAE